MFKNAFINTGPTVLEVFNTLLRQLRLSVDYELTGSYDGSTNIGTKIIKAHEERQLQEAVIRTIGESVGFPLNIFCLPHISFQPHPLLINLCHSAILSDFFRIICQHSPNIPEVRGHALHHGQDPCPWGSPHAALNRLRVIYSLQMHSHLFFQHVTGMHISVCHKC